MENFYYSLVKRLCVMYTDVVSSCDVEMENKLLINEGVLAGIENIVFT